MYFLLNSKYFFIDILSSSLNQLLLYVEGDCTYDHGLPWMQEFNVVPAKEILRHKKIQILP